MNTGFKILVIILLCIIAGALGYLAFAKYQDKQEKNEIVSKISTNIDASRCNEVAKTFSKIVDKTVEYEAATGEYPSSLDELELEFPSPYWRYSILNSESQNVLSFRAQLIKSIGNIKEDNYVTLTWDLNTFDFIKHHSHTDFKNLYMTAYLEDSEKIVD